MQLDASQLYMHHADMTQNFTHAKHHQSLSLPRLELNHSSEQYSVVLLNVTSPFIVKIIWPDMNSITAQNDISVVLLNVTSPFIVKIIWPDMNSITAQNDISVVLLNVTSCFIVKIYWLDIWRDSRFSNLSVLDIADSLDTMVLSFTGTMAMDHL